MWWDCETFHKPSGIVKLFMIPAPAWEPEFHFLKVDLARKSLRVGGCSAEVEAPFVNLHLLMIPAHEAGDDQG